MKSNERWITVFGASLRVVDGFGGAHNWAFKIGDAGISTALGADSGDDGAVIDVTVFGDIPSK